MKKNLLLISFVLAHFIAFSNIAQAAAVRTFVKNGTVTINGQEYDEILVKCKTSLEVTNNILRAKDSRMWCAGIDLDRCFSKSEIKAAQAVCKNAYLEELEALNTGTSNATKVSAPTISQEIQQKAEAAIVEKAPEVNTPVGTLKTEDVIKPAGDQDKLRQELIEIEKQRIEMKERELQLRQKELELQKRELGS